MVTASAIQPPVQDSAVASISPRRLSALPTFAASSYSTGSGIYRSRGVRSDRWHGADLTYQLITYQLITCHLSRSHGLHDREDQQCIKRGDQIVQHDAEAVLERAL